MPESKLKVKFVNFSTLPPETLDYCTTTAYPQINQTGSIMVQKRYKLKKNLESGKSENEDLNRLPNVELFEVQKSKKAYMPIIEKQYH